MIEAPNTALAASGTLPLAREAAWDFLQDQPVCVCDRRGRRAGVGPELYPHGAVRPRRFYYGLQAGFIRPDRTALW